MSVQIPNNLNQMFERGLNPCLGQNETRFYFHELISLNFEKLFNFKPDIAICDLNNVRSKFL